MKGKSYKVLAIVLVLLMLMTALAGCGGSSSSGSSSSSSSSSSSEPAEEPAEESGESVKEELVIAMTNDVQALDPMKCWQVAAYHIYWTVYERLIRYDAETGTYEPELAESWEVLDDGGAYLFHLREGVKWHDGSDFVAEDVKYTIERGIELGTGNYPGVDHVEVVDDHTVKVVMEAPDSVFMDKQWTGDCCVIKKDSGDQLSLEPLGTGPYKFVEWVSGDHITIEAFDDWWGEQSGTKKITLRIIPEANSRLVALQTGEVDIAPLDATAVSNAVNDDNLNVLSTTSISVNYLGFNCEKEYFDNELVRKAICHAIDKDSIIEAQLEGQGIPLTTFVAPGKMGYYDGFGDYGYDVEKAKELLAEAGYPDGFECVLTTSADKWTLAAQIIQSNLADIGIKVTINEMEASAYADACANGNTELFMGSRSGGSADSYVGMLDSNKLGVNGNRFFYINPDMDELLKKSHLTIDLEARNEVYKEIQEVIHEHAPTLPLYAPTIFLGINKNVKGLTVDNEGCHDYRHAYYAE